MEFDPARLAFWESTWAVVLRCPASKMSTILGHVPAACLVCPVEGSRCAAKSDLLQAMSESLRFPSYFGHNWDALEECLRDLSWFQSGAIAIVFREADRVLESSPKEFETLIAILGDVAHAWTSSEPRERGGEKQRGFHVVFHCEPDREGALLARLSAIPSELLFWKS